MKHGYIKLFRSMQEHQFWEEKREFSKAEAWIDMIFEAQFEKHTRQKLIGNKVYKISRGEIIKSTRDWAKRWRWSQAKVRRFFKVLLDMSQIRLKSDSDVTHITIENYCKYQDSRLKSDSDVTHLRLTCDSPSYKNFQNSNHLDPPNKGKKVRREENNPPIVPPRGEEGQSKKATIPYQDIFQLYRNILSDSMVKHPNLTETMQDKIKARWNASPYRRSLDWWKGFFEYCSKSPFLSGQVKPTNGRKQFKCSLQWLLGKENMGKVESGFYHDGALMGSTQEPQQKTQAEIIRELGERAARGELKPEELMQ